jgi:hypothetical protein
VTIVDETSVCAKFDTGHTSENCCDILAQKEFTRCGQTQQIFANGFTQRNTARMSPLKMPNSAMGRGAFLTRCMETVTKHCETLRRSIRPSVADARTAPNPVGGHQDCGQLNIEETGWHYLRVTGQGLPAAGAPYEAIVTYTGTPQLP